MGHEARVLPGGRRRVAAAEEYRAEGLPQGAAHATAPGRLRAELRKGAYARDAAHEDQPQPLDPILSRSIPSALSKMPILRRFNTFHEM